MSHWNYRVVRLRSGNFGLYEVYYRDDGTPEARTVEPIGFTADSVEGVEGLLKDLRRALKDAEERPILDEPEGWK